MDLCLYTFTALNDGRKKSAKISQVTGTGTFPKCHAWWGGGVFWGVKKYCSNIKVNNR